MARNKFLQLSVLLLLLGALPVLIAPAHADTDDSISEGIKAYQAQNYIQAAASLETVVRSGHNNGHVWYDLGNAYYRLGKIGKAIAAYRRALIQIPDDPDVRANLNLARKQAKDQIDPDPTVLESMLRVLPPVSQQTYEQIFIVIYVLGWFGFVVYFLTGSATARKAAYSLLGASAIFALLAFAMRPGFKDVPHLALTPSARMLHPGVITATETKIYSGDGESYQVVFLLHDGAEVMCGERRGTWQEIILPDGRKGWLQNIEIDTVSS